MIEKTCNFWLERAEFRCIPTSGAVSPEGPAIMDFSLAKQAVEQFSNLDGDLGLLLSSRGNHVHSLRPDLLSFPVKQFLWSALDLKIIKRSGHELKEIVGEAKTLLAFPETGAALPTREQFIETLSFLPDTVILVTNK
ncbi:MAG: hypothetical protein GY778_00285 [bacterium]|nr:hypothetical protein [bacterium]